MRLTKSALTIFATGAGLLLALSARAQIGIQSGPSPIEYNAVTLNTATFTVPSGASTLVVFVSTRNQGSTANPGLPTNVKWGASALTLAVSENPGTSTYDYNMIYYLMNPPAGTASVTATLNLASGGQTWWMAYTLTNVNTNAPLTGNSLTTSGTTINNTIGGVAAGDWAAVSGSGGAVSSTVVLTTSPNSGTILTTTDNAHGNATQTLGSVSNCPAGNNQFILTDSVGSSKIVMCEAVFTPYYPPPPAPVLNATPASPAQVDLSWTEAANSGTSSFILMRGHTPGTFTDFTNILAPNVTTYTDEAVASGTTYYYQIAAVNSAGTNFSSTASATPVGPPFAPALGAGAFGVGAISLHWTPTFGTANYVLLRSQTSGTETMYTTLTTNKYVDTGLAPGTTYYYKVESVGPGGTSALSDEASAVVLGSGFYLFDNFSLDTAGAALNGQTGSAGLGAGWTNLGGGAPILVTNGPTFNGANYAQYAPLSPTSIGDYEAGLGIASNATASTVFLEFSLPGITNIFGNWGLSNASQLVAMNFDIDNSSPPGALTGSSATGPSAQFNYDNSTGFGFFRVNSSGTFYYVTLSPTNTPYLPIPGDVYYFWFVINAAKGTFQIYLANGSETGNNVDSGGLGVAPTLMWGTTATNGTGSVITYGFRNVSAGGAIGQPVNYIGTGPGSTLGSVAQNEFAEIYVDPVALNLTNPVTGAPPTGAPLVLQQPLPLELYAGATASFSIIGSAGVNFQWESNGVPMANNSRVSGVTTSTLTISNVTASDAVNYSCVINNPATSAFASSSSAALTIVTPNGAFETALAATGPGHFYAFDDTNDPSTGTEVAFDYAGGDNGIYGANTQNGFNGIAGPRPSPDNFPGFSSGNLAAQFAGFAEPSHVTINSPWNFNTNTVTITAWIKPASLQDNSAAIVLNRGSGSDVEGLNFNTSGHSTLGYIWNNDPNTSGWDSGLQPPSGQWSFVALVVTSTNATIDMMNTDGEFSSSFTYSNVPAAFGGTTMIGDDSGTTTGALTFIGAIDDVGVFGTALSQAQLQQMFTDASGVSEYPATNTIALVSAQPIYPGQTALLTSVDGGSVPLTLIWQLDGTNLTDGPNAIGYVYGSATGNLTISNLAAGDAGQTYNFTLVASNSVDTYTSPPVSMSVTGPSGPQAINTTEMEAQGLDWNTGASWSDNNPASVSVYSEPGSTYYVLPGTLERSPVSTNATFPGQVMVIEGNGVLIDGASAGFATQTTTGELRLKESGTVNATNFGTVYALGGTVSFPDLQLNGGQLDNGSSSLVVVDGEIDVLTNSSIYADSSSAASIRSFQINALLTGTGTLTYSFLGSASDITNNDLIISNPGNTFSGQWNVQQGALLGNAPNSLGTNSITVGVNGALETTYNLNNPNGNLVLNGQMYLYMTDTFYALAINGSNMPPGTYTFAQLNSAFPANFPASWVVQLGSSTGANTGAGSITVLASLPPVFTQQPTSLSLYPGQTAQFSATVLYATNYQWWFTNLSNVGSQLVDGPGISGSLTTSLTISNVANANAGTYVLIAGGPGGNTTSSQATLTVLSPGGATTITTTEIEAVGLDWNTPASWNDNLAVSVSIYANPGSTYEIVPGTEERSPIATDAVFPGIVLAVQGDGVLLDGNNVSFATQTTTGELRLKESGGTVATNFGTVYTLGGSVTFPDLQLQGGQIDNGNSSVVALDGEIEVLADSSIYADSAAAGSIRSFQVNAFLTGTGTLTYSYLSTNYMNNDLAISCPTNTFSGQWNVLQGALVGNAPNALGTNSITVQANGALETTYNLTAPKATLTLNGQMYLHTADTFYAATVNGTALSPGTFSFAQLNSAYPANFPATWPIQLGSSTGAGSGSLTILTGPPPPVPPTIGTVSVSGGNINLAGTGGTINGTYRILTSTDVTQALHTWTVVANGSFDGAGNFSIMVPLTPGNNQQFYTLVSP